MELKLYDTLSKEKRAFKPLDPSSVRMYVCGPTVYDFAHIGNARPVIVFDVLFRLLRHLYGDANVKYARNITDVDDKINDRAARDYPGMPLNDAIRKVTEQTEKQFHADVDALGCLRPSVEPRATEHIGEMRTIIDRLIANGNAYVAEDHVLFSVATDKNYGKLARRSLDEMIAGARVDVAPYKREPTDFVLWKPSKPGEPSWPSPGGIKPEGRPGWHIECSAMAWKHLGEQFDIHGGGIDLVFPHHENEIAQSCCAFHTDRMANVWMHNGFLQVEGEKMSKSTGNFVTIHELLETDKFGGRKWPGEVLRLAMLKTHYRSPIDWTSESLADSEKSLIKWGRSLAQFLYHDHNTEENSGSAFLPHELVDALANDLNTAGMFALLHRLSADALAGSFESARSLYASLKFLGLGSVRLFSAFGLIDEIENLDDLQETQRIVENRIGKLKIIELVERRDRARLGRNWTESDRIRDELAAMGVAIKDGKDADGKPVTTWEIAR